MKPNPLIPCPCTPEGAAPTKVMQVTKEPRELHGYPKQGDWLWGLAIWFSFISSSSVFETDYQLCFLRNQFCNWRGSEVACVLTLWDKTRATTAFHPLQSTDKEKGWVTKIDKSP